LRLLILGGSGFLGQVIVDSALAQNHEVTLFHRGQLDPTGRPEVETLLGDRDGDLALLAGHKWDAAIDTCGYIPRLVRDAAVVLADAVDHYTFLSTVNVYAVPTPKTVDEDAPLDLGDASPEELSYGPLKALCEQAATQAMNGRALNIRPGLIVGPGDRSDRFTYWPWRIARGKEVLAPGDPLARVQFIDVRDLAVWTLQAIEQQLTGPYNAVGPALPISMENVLACCLDQIGGDASLTWVSEEFLLANGVVPYTEMPLWRSAGAADFSRIDSSRAIAAGLTLRPLAETVLDTLFWAQTRPENYHWTSGMRPEREADLLAQWQKGS
jgi:2'-hydroxyisoflavone reductase